MYHFSPMKNLKRVDAGEFLEWAQCSWSLLWHGSNPRLDRLISAGQSVVLEIDVQGWTYGFTNNTPTPSLVFTVSPSFSYLNSALEAVVGTEDEKTHFYETF